MDTHKLYCRNSMSFTSSTVPSNGTSARNLYECTTCDSKYSAAATAKTKETISRSSHISEKSSHHNMRTNVCGLAYSNSIINSQTVSTPGSLDSTFSSGVHCSNSSRIFNSIDSTITSEVHCNNSNKSYINMMPIPTGMPQYHRKKLTPQDYQSRSYHNTGEYRCRDDFYSASCIGGCSSEASNLISVPSIQLQGQMHQINHQTQSAHPHHSISQQPHQHHFHNYSQQQQSTSAVSIHKHHSHKNQCISTAAAEHVEDAMTSSLSLVNGRMVAATQAHQISFCEQVLAPTTLAMSTLQSQVPPIMYTVHRVVTTAQIHTASGTSFTSSASVSNVVSSDQNATDSMGNVLTPVSTSSKTGCFVTGEIPSCSANTTTDGNFNSSNAVGQSILHSSTGISTNATNFFKSQTDGGATAEVTRPGNTEQRNLPQMAAESVENDTETAASVSRPLQNVIPTCVYLMSRVAVHMEIEGTSQCPSQVMLAAALGCEELGIANKLLAQSIFGLWMTSTLLEIQLKSHHRPYVVRVAWPGLLEKFSHGNPLEKKYDEPMIMLKRNVFFSKRDEEKIKDHRILELLYEEAKHNVLTGRYIMESVHSLMLGGIQSRIELGHFNAHTHTVSFFRENQSRFLPQHVAKNSSWSWLPVSRKNSAEVRLLEQFKRVPQTATTRKLMRKYLEFCWALPFYGAAFFHGQVEQHVRGLMSIVNHKDIEVFIAVNERGLFLIDPAECTLLLGLRYEDLSWDFAKPSTNEDSECQTCIFLQFDVVENAIQVSKLMQIFSKQAPMIDALVSHFTENVRKRKLDGNNTDQYHDEPNPIQNNGNGVLCNKLSRLTLATFDGDGRCIGQMGSLSITY